MKLPRRQFLHVAAGAAALPAVSRFAWAQTYPSRPVRIIVGVAPGGQTTSSRASWVNGCRSGSVSHSLSRTGQAQAPISPPKRSFVLLPMAIRFSVSPSNDQRDALRKNQFTFIGDIAPVAGIIRAANVMVVNSIRFRPRRFPSLSPTPRPTPASSTCRRAATEPRMSPANCSK